MSLVDLNPAGLNLASLKPTTADSIAQDEAAQVQADTARVQLTNAQDEQQQNHAFRTQLAVVAKAPTADGYAGLLAIAPRQYVEGIKASMSHMDATEKKALANQVLEPWIAGVSGRPDLQKLKLEAQRDGFAAKGMTAKATGVQDLIDKMKTDPDGVTTKLYATYVEAAGPERAKAVLDSLGMTEERLKKKADRILAEANADRGKTDAAKREQVAKAKTAEIDAQYKEKDTLATIRNKDATADRDLAAGEHSTYLTEKGRLTMGDEVAKAAADNRTAQAAATVAEAGATKDAIEAKLAHEKEQTKLFKAQADQARTVLGDLPPGVQEIVRKDMDASAEAMAAAGRTRRALEGYRRISASAPAGMMGKLGAWAREVAGTQNQRDRLNQLAEGVLVEEVVNKAQQIRPVSDNDTAMLRKPLPDPRGNPKLVADFMEALARVQEKQASVTADRAAWQAEFRGPGKAREDTSVNGVNVKAGEALDSFLRRAGHVRDAISYARNPGTPPEKQAETLKRLKAAGENVDGR